MTYLKERFINPFTDYGFKRLFGEEPNKDLLLDFLNQLLKEQEGEIVDLQYTNAEQLGLNKYERNAIFDIYCTNVKGEHFIVEMQKAEQDYFKDRALFYSSFPIQKQAKKGKWNFELKAVYTIAILDFIFDKDKAEIGKFRYNVKLSDIDTCKVFYNKLTFIYLEMPKFTKKVEELETSFDKWMYVLKNLPTLEKIPNKLKTKIFNKVFDVAEIANFTPSQHSEYEYSLKNYRDMQNVIDTQARISKEEGRQEGMIEGKIEGKLEGKIEGRQEGKIEGRQEGIEERSIRTACIGLKSGLDLEFISELSGLSVDLIKKLKC